MIHGVWLTVWFWVDMVMHKTLDRVPQRVEWRDLPLLPEQLAWDCAISGYVYATLSQYTAREDVVRLLASLGVVVNVRGGGPTRMLYLQFD